jgi:bifunctional non-homologous end joining protein LigD
MANRTKATSRASKLVEEQLARYRSMRDFHLTAEPSGGAHPSPLQPGNALPFVIQKHAATRLHYDFRLGWNGVMKSWAVTKGPSFFPGDKRLAVEVEDHPIEYAGFEGTIPKGQYGGGTVMIWDFGDWRPLVDVDRGLKEGNLKFQLFGKKLRGAWALVRMHGRNERPDKPNWLLIKERDEFVRAEGDAAITDTAPTSAVTKRTMEQIAASEDHVWNSKSREQRALEERTAPRLAPVAEPLRLGIKRVPRRGHPTKRLVTSAPPERFPGFIAPQLAEQATAAPDEGDWIHEVKLDGYRIQVHVRSGKKNGKTMRTVTLFTRKGLDWTHRMPDIAQAAAALPVTEAIFDGEAVVLDENGVSSFAEMQAALQEGKDRFITYFAFDLLHLDGHNLRGLPLLERKEILSGILQGDRSGSPIRLSEHLEAKGSAVFAKACALGAEGIVSKLKSGSYAEGRSGGWRKVKCTLEQEFVILGFTAPSKGGHGIGALLLGYYEGGQLRYAGRVGTGFSQKTSGDLRTRLNRMVEKQSSLSEIPPDARRGVFWVKPELVAQVSFATWTNDDLVRQASFQSLREDKPAFDVERESAVPMTTSRRGHRSTSTKTQPGIQARKVIKHQPGANRTAPPTMNQAAVALPITHPNKVMDPVSGMTKQMLAEYYVAVAERMLPHISDRPLSVVRCPEGTSSQCFFQKHIGMGMPAGVNSVSVPNRKTGKREEYLTLTSAEGLVGLAQMGVLEIHPWGSRNESLEHPDRVVFDLDPDQAIVWKTLAASAQELRERLKRLGLVSFLKHTGGNGLHIVVPIEPVHSWATVKEFAYELVLGIEREQPNLYVTKMTKAIRGGRIYLDYLRNEREATSIAPFSPRARSGAPVAVTLSWRELESATAPSFHVADLARWRSRLNRDPWKEMAGIQQTLPAEAIKTGAVRSKR